MAYNTHCRSESGWRNSAMSSEEESTTCEEKGQARFVELLQKHKVVLHKSQVPTRKKAKDDALKKLQAEWQEVTGKAISVKQISKKINNFRTKIKQKVDINKTCHKQIAKLKPWEQAFLELMDGDRQNPDRVPVPGGAVQVSLSPLIQTGDTGDSANNCSASFSSVLLPETEKTTVSKKLKTPHLPETKETQHLSTAELHRLVLLETLEILRLKKRKLMRELE